MIRADSTQDLRGLLCSRGSNIHSRTAVLVSLPPAGPGEGPLFSNALPRTSAVLSLLW